MRGEEGKRIKVKGTQHRGEEYREEDNLGEHTIPLVHHPSYRLPSSVLVPRPFRYSVPYRSPSVLPRPMLPSLRYGRVLRPLHSTPFRPAGAR